MYETKMGGRARSKIENLEASATAADPCDFLDFSKFSKKSKFSKNGQNHVLGWFSSIFGSGFEFCAKNAI